MQLPEQQNRYQLLLVELYGNDPRVGSAQRLELLQSISAFEEEMAEEGFIRVHRSYIVPARDCIQTSRTSWGGLLVHLRNGQVIPVGRKFKDKLQALMG